MVDQNQIDYSCYLNYFKGREDHFAYQGEDYYYPVAKPFDDYYLQNHLSGVATFGLYVLTSESKCHLICFDIDIPKDELKSIVFTKPETKYEYLKPKILEIIQLLVEKFELPQESILLEDTGGRGYHIWLFFEESIPGDDAVLLYHIIKQYIEFDFEFFPKQGHLDENRKFGNLIKLPLGIHRKYHSCSRFLKLVERTISFIDELETNLDHLKTIKKIPKKNIDGILEKHRGLLKEVRQQPPLPTERHLVTRPLFKGDINSLLTNCSALAQLRKKAEGGVPFSHKEAFHFANVMLSIQDGRNFLVDTIRRSFGSKFSTEVTNHQLNRIASLLPSSCSTLVSQGICHQFCTDKVKRQNLDALLPNTNPGSVWLNRETTVPSPLPDELLDLIADAQNVENAYWKLKYYHEHEDALFYDEFDFLHFEANLQVNCRYIARTLKIKQDIPFVGYSKVEIPKKLDEKNKMQYRQMAFSTVYVQVIIQSITNIVARILEHNFHECSYGYRWNLEEKDPHLIFLDWREYYPIFKSKLLNQVRSNPAGSYVCCDIKGFYDSIDHEILLEQLRGYLTDKYIFSVLKKIIELYSFEDGTQKGIPQGPAYARLLANLYLNDFDLYAKNHTTAYFRYVDDFYLFFESEGQARHGLKDVIGELERLGLRLSDDEKKRPEVISNLNEERILSTLDKIQYGILEEARHLTTADSERVIQFYDAIERHSVSPKDLEEFLAINDKLPSLTYAVTRKSLFPHPLAEKLPRIINFMIDKRLFYSSRLKTVFYRLIELMSEAGHDLSNLYTRLEPAHQIYFILSLYGIFTIHNKHKKALQDVVILALQGENTYAKGFAVPILKKIGGDDWRRVKEGGLIRFILDEDCHFVTVKLLGEIDYIALSPDEKASIREFLKAESSYLTKMTLLLSLRSQPVDYLDDKFLVRLLSQNIFFLLPACSRLFVLITGNTQLFRFLAKFISTQVDYKVLTIEHLKALISEKGSKLSNAEITNLCDLHQTLSDPELKRDLTAALDRIGRYRLPGQDEFSRQHLLVEQYNESLLFRHTTNTEEYEYLELIPQARLSQFFSGSVGDLRIIVEDLSDQQVLPLVQFAYDSGIKEVSLSYKFLGLYYPLSEHSFKLDEENIIYALNLAENLYKKAQYYYRRFGRAPLIELGNLLINTQDKSLVFWKFGAGLSPRYVISGESIKGDRHDIPKMISLLLRTMFFGVDKSKVEPFLKKVNRKGVELFLAHFIQNMAQKKMSMRYSYARFSYLVQKLNELQGCNESEITILYLRERLKGALFRRNNDILNWANICRAAADHLPQIREACNRSILRKAAFRNKTFLNWRRPRGLHYLSEQLLNVCLNSEELVPSSTSMVDYVGLIDLICHFIMCCIEVISFFRIQEGAIPDSVVELLDGAEDVILSGCGYQQVYDAEDRRMIRTCLKKGIHAGYLQEEAVIPTIKQMAFIYLVTNYCVRKDECRVEIHNDERLKKKAFRNLVYCCLVRLPRIEENVEKIISCIMKALEHGYDFELGHANPPIKQDVYEACKTLSSVKKYLKYKRENGRTQTKRWPPDIGCKRFLRSMRKASEKDLIDIPVSDRFPSSPSRSSWDLRDNKVVNLVIPNGRLTSLLSDLKTGRLFGYRFQYLYSGRSMLLWDTLLFLMSSFLLVTCRHYAIDSTKPVIDALYWIGTIMLTPSLLFFLGKVLFVDIGHYSESAKKLMQYFRNVSKQDAKDPSGSS